SGVADALLDQRCVLAGGHSSEGVETHLGIAVTGEVSAGGRRAKCTARAGDHLVLTQALGTGVILAANQTGNAPAEAIEHAARLMLNDNRAASAALTGATALTDVTGYGLVGHLLEMLDGTALEAELDLRSIPAITGAMALFEGGWRSTLHPALLPLLAETDRDCDDALGALCLDPQTSGGLLAAVPPERVDALRGEHPAWAWIGELRARQAAAGPRIRLLGV
ncbi:MAG: selenide, water dikinase SelD, partial [Pseudomonadota bacterium]